MITAMTGYLAEIRPGQQRRYVAIFLDDYYLIPGNRPRIPGTPKRPDLGMLDVNDEIPGHPQRFQVGPAQAIHCFDFPDYFDSISQ